MRIFIIGSEGSGKTVFLAMLSRYVANQRNDLVIEPIDYATSQYVATAQAALERGDWPRGNPPGKLQLLKWRVGRRGKTLHELEMFDSAGQDLRQLLLEDDQASLTAEQQAIRSCIDESDVLFYLLDLEVFIGSKDLCALNENAWLFKTFLTRPAWQGKKRSVVLSKADIYSDVITQYAGNFREIIKSRLPTVFSMEHLLDTPTTVDYLAVTSVATTTVIADDGSPRRIPQNPLQAGDFGPFVHSLLTGLGEPDLGKDAKAVGSGVSDDESSAMVLGGFIGGFIGICVIRDFYLGGLIGGFVGVLIALMVASVIEKPTAGSVGTLIGGVIIGGGIGLWAIGGFVGGLVGVIVGVLIGGFIGVLIAIGIEKPTTRSIRTSISEPWATPPQWTRGTWSIGEPNGEPAVEILISDDSPIGRPLAELGDKPDRGKQRRGKVPAKSGQRRTKKRPDQTNQ